MVQSEGMMFLVGGDGDDGAVGPLAKGMSSVPHGSCEIHKMRRLQQNGERQKGMESG